MATSEVASSDVALDVQHVTKKYGGFRKVAVLQDANLQVRKGNHLLILGPNGAGKTTLLKCILGLASFEGTIMVNGIDVKKDSTAVKRTLGYMPQNYAFYENLSVLQQAKMSQSLKNRSEEETKEKLQIVDLWNVRNRKVRALSDGMRQRLGIALALIGNPPFLILDEPTSNIDLRGQLDFQDLLLRLLKEGKTMVTTTHLTGLGELASQVMVLDKGKMIYYGKPEELLGSLDVADTLYLRVDSSRYDDLKRFIAGNLKDELISKGNWSIVPLHNAVKLKFLKALLESGIKIDDLMLERTSIESEYLKLVERHAAK
jgi:ABC-type multidrug transport system ATPase subunit